ncbi:MAG: SLC13 family permease [Synergistaceae bacterium]|nr:SLC13 family permease [Synergistaceae bacterium]
MNIALIVAVLIFCAMFLLVVSEKFEKQHVTLACGALMLIVVLGIIMRDMNAIIDVLNFKSILQGGFWIGEAPDSLGIDWATIIFLGGMMIMVEGMSEAGFFRWLCLRLAKAVNYRTIPIFIVFMLLAAVLSMFIDSITVIMFLAAVTVELSKILKFNPIPCILSEIFCANLGGSITMCGDPPNIIIGSKLHYSFSDFLLNTGLIAAICLVFVIIYFYFIYRNELRNSGKQVDASSIPDPSEAIKNKKDFLANAVIFALAIVLLTTNIMTHMSVAFIGAVIGLITCLVNFKKIGTILKRVDYKLLLFFVGLFIVVAGLEHTGAINEIVELIVQVSGGNIKMMVAIVIWVSAVASAFIDNIPFAATMVPIIKTLAAGDPAVQATLAWTLSIGTDVGGAATPIGASANVVGTAVANRNGYPIGWGKYCKGAVPATIMVVTISMIIIFIRYC